MGVVAGAGTYKGVIPGKPWVTQISEAVEKEDNTTFLHLLTTTVTLNHWEFAAPVLQTAIRVKNWFALRTIFTCDKIGHHILYAFSEAFVSQALLSSLEGVIEAPYCFFITSKSGAEEQELLELFLKKVCECESKAPLPGAFVGQMKENVINALHKQSSYFSVSEEPPEMLTQINKALKEFSEKERRSERDYLLLGSSLRGILRTERLLTVADAVIVTDGATTVTEGDKEAVLMADSPKEIACITTGAEIAISSDGSLRDLAKKIQPYKNNRYYRAGQILGAKNPFLTILKMQMNSSPASLQARIRALGLEPESIAERVLEITSALFSSG